MYKKKKKNLPTIKSQKRSPERFGKTEIRPFNTVTEALLVRVGVCSPRKIPELSVAARDFCLEDVFYVFSLINNRH